jgi:hypothetical protein
MENSGGGGGMSGEERFYYSVGIFPDIFFVRMGFLKRKPTAVQYTFLEF